MLDGDPDAGKALALDTPIPTPNGFVEMGNLNVGDTVYDGYGKETKITNVSPIFYDHDCYKVVFDDESEVVADGGHLWKVQTAQQRRNVQKWKVNPKKVVVNKKESHTTLTTREMLSHITHGSDNRLNYSTDIVPFCGTHKELLVPPYVLGAWLGDGTAASSEFTTADAEILQHIKDAGVETTLINNNTGINLKGKARSYRLGGTNGKSVVRNRAQNGTFTGIKSSTALVTKLRTLSVINNKHIPQEYLLSSIEQRMELLQGLMDTDGCCLNRSGACEYVSVSATLISNVSTLLSGLGIKHTTKTKVGTGFGKACTSYRINFTTGRQVFKLTRKLALLSKRTTPYVTRRYIKSITQCATVPTRCITVASADHTYLCTDKCIVTHNSWVWMALTAGLTGSTICPLPYDKTAIQNAKVLILTHEDNAKVTLKKRLKLMGARLSNIQTIAVEREVPEDDDEYSGLQGINANDLLEASPIIKELHPDLIVIDPLVLFTSTLSSFDSDKGNKVRELFNQIQVLTRQVGCAFLIVRHFRKQGAQKAIHRGVGSIDHVAAARSVLIVAQNKDNGDRYISHAKSNLAAKGPTITYTLNENDHPPFQWSGTNSDITADSLTDDYSNAKDSDAKDAKEDAVEFLLGELEDGPVPTAELIKRAGSLKITQSALNKAKKELKIHSRKMKEEGKTAVWVLELPKKSETVGGDA
jgi:hypothetical protein